MTALKHKLISVFPEIVGLWNKKQRGCRRIEILPDGLILDINLWDEFTTGDGVEYRTKYTIDEFVGKEYWRLRKIYFKELKKGEGENE